MEKELETQIATRTREGFMKRFLYDYQYHVQVCLGRHLCRNSAAASRVYCQGLTVAGVAQGFKNYRSSFLVRLL